MKNTKKSRRKKLTSSALAPTSNDALPAADAAFAAPAFEPTLADHQMFHAYVSLLAEGKGVTHTALAKQLKVTRPAVSLRFMRRPGLQRWIGEQLRASMDQLWGPVVHRIGAIALQKGSVIHAELYGKMLGLLKDSGTPVTPGAAPTVTVNVVGIADPVSLKEWPGGTLEAPKT